MRWFTPILREFKVLGVACASAVQASCKRFVRQVGHKEFLAKGMFGLRRLALICALLVLANTPSPVIASDMIDVLVNGQDDAEKLNAYQVAMRWMLQRRSDGASLSGNEAVREAMRNAIDFVDEFEFLPAESEFAADTSLPVTSKVRETGAVTHILRVTLSAPALAALLADQVVELKTESTVQRVPKQALVWLLINDAGREILISEANANNVVGRLRELAGGLGWNLYFPQLDTLDLSLIGPLELAQERIASITAASQRYDQALTLSGVLSRDITGRWEAKWLRLPISQNLSADPSLASSEEAAQAVRRLQMEPELVSLDALLQQGMMWLTGELDDQGRSASNTSLALPNVAEAGDTAMADGEELELQGKTTSVALGNNLGPSSLRGREAMVWVAGANSAANSSQIYQRSLKLLKSVAAVESVQPRELRPDGILFVVSPRAAIAGIASTARASNWLRTTDEAVSADSPEDETGAETGAGVNPSTADATNKAAFKRAAIRADLYLQLLPK